MNYRNGCGFSEQPGGHGLENLRGFALQCSRQSRAPLSGICSLPLWRPVSEREPLKVGYPPAGADWRQVW